MKKISGIICLLFIITFASACSPGAGKNAESVGNSEALAARGEEPAAVYANQVKDGKYEISVSSSSSMFRVVKCELIAKNGKMQAVMTMSGKGYGMVYMGTAKEAQDAPESTYIPFVLNENEEKTFTVPLEALNQETECAAWSIKKEKWYDRTLVFKSEGVALSAADGTYSAVAELRGGTGKAKIKNATVEIIDGKPTATIEWSSPYYEYMLIGETKYEPVKKGGNATFKIPIVLDEEIKVRALTVAMSEPHLIDYTLYFDSLALKGEK